MAAWARLGAGGHPGMDGLEDLKAVTSIALGDWLTASHSAHKELIWGHLFSHKLYWALQNKYNWFFVFKNWEKYFKVALHLFIIINIRFTPYRN